MDHEVYGTCAHLQENQFLRYNKFLHKKINRNNALNLKSDINILNPGSACHTNITHNESNKIVNKILN